MPLFGKFLIYVMKLNFSRYGHHNIKASRDTKWESNTSEQKPPLHPKNAPKAFVSFTP